MFRKLAEQLSQMNESDALAGLKPSADCKENGLKPTALTI
jgi:hypothetical protein